MYREIDGCPSCHRATLCLLRSASDPILFPNVSLPEDQTVREGELAQFFCHVSSTEEEVILQFSPFLSVAFLLHSPSSGTLTPCFSCSFSRFEIGECRVTGEPACAGLQFSNTSSGVAGVRSHQLAAQWGQVGINHSGSEVVCALAVSAVTQWTQTATLTVLPASPSPQPSDEREAGLLALASLVAVGVVAVGVCAGVLVCWCKRHGRKNASQTLREQGEPLLSLWPQLCHLLCVTCRLCSTSGHGVSVVQRQLHTNTCSHAQVPSRRGARHQSQLPASWSWSGEDWAHWVCGAPGRQAECGLGPRLQEQC